MPPGPGDELPAVLLLLISLGSLDSFVDDIGEGFWGMISSPAAGAGAAATAAALILEPGDDLSGFMGTGFADDASSACNLIFGYPSIALTSAAWAAGGISGNHALEQTGMRCTEALVMGGGICGLLKICTGRERPDGSDNLSFPSFHSTSSAAVAAVVWSEHGPGAGVPLAVLSAFTALSRIHRGVHHVSDVVAGLALGTAAGLAMADLDGDDGAENGFQRRRNGSGPVIGLSVSGDGIIPFVR